VAAGAKGNCVGLQVVLVAIWISRTFTMLVRVLSSTRCGEPLQFSDLEIKFPDLDDTDAFRQLEAECNFFVSCTIAI
jgi:hypothetical protein